MKLGNTMPLAALLAVLSLALPAMDARAESLQGSNIDSRIMVGFRVDPADLGPWMPEGWSPLPFPSGPMKGATLMITLEDRALQLDAEGKPAIPASSRGLAFLGLAKPDTDQPPRLLLYRLFTSIPDHDPYGNASHAAISRSTAATGPSAGGLTRTEAWTVAPADGGSLTLALDYAAGPAFWSSSEARLFSNRDPERHSILRYDQLVRIAASEAMGKPLDGTLDYSSDIAELAGIFDGDEAVVSILDIPVYVREIYAP